MKWWPLFVENELRLELGFRKWCYADVMALARRSAKSGATAHCDTDDDETNDTSIFMSYLTLYVCQSQHSNYHPMETSSYSRLYSLALFSYSPMSSENSFLPKTRMLISAKTRRKRPSMRITRSTTIIRFLVRVHVPPGARSVIYERKLTPHLPSKNHFPVDMISISA